MFIEVMDMNGNNSFNEEEIYRLELIKQRARLDEQDRRDKIKAAKKKEEEKRKQLVKIFIDGTIYLFAFYMLYKVYIMFSTNFHF